MFIWFGLDTYSGGICEYWRCQEPYFSFIYVFVMLQWLINLGFLINTGENDL